MISPRSPRSLHDFFSRSSIRRGATCPDFWKRSRRPSFVDRTPLATLTAHTPSHSVGRSRRRCRASSHLPGKERTPPGPYGPFLAAVCKYEGREGSSSSRTTDRGASYRIPSPFVFAIRDYVTTMIHDDIYFGISSARALLPSLSPSPPPPPLSLSLSLSFPVIPRGRSLSSRATCSFCAVAATRAR